MCVRLAPQVRDSEAGLGPGTGVGRLPVSSEAESGCLSESQDASLSESQDVAFPAHSTHVLDNYKQERRETGWFQDWRVVA